MRNIWTIARREYKLYFMSPVAYAVAFLLFIWVGRIFYLNVADSIDNMMYGSADPNAQLVVGPMVLVLVFTIPAITMRLLAEEQRSGTMELLLTAPMRDGEMVVGKWLGAFLFMMAILASTIILPVILQLMVKPGIDQGLMLGGYLGIALLIASLLGIGIALSALFSNQIVAFFAGLAIALILVLLRASQGSGTGVEILNYLNYLDHFDNFYQGVIDLKDIVYYLSVTALGLFLGTTFIESRRWR